MPRGGLRSGSGRPKGQGKFGVATTPIRVPENMVSQVLEFVQNSSQNQAYNLPLFASKVSAGFPSPADDYLEGIIDLNRHLIKHPTATFLVRAKGDSMIDCGINENDILIVDRSLDAHHGNVVIAAINGELTVKRLHKKDGKIFLLPENKKYKPIEMSESAEMVIWGVVTNVIHEL